MTKRTALEFVARESWAIRPEWLETICSIAEREHEYAGDVSALEQKLGRSLNNSQTTTVRDGVAIVPVTGPLFRYANLMTELSGATSYATLATDLRAAVDDPAVTAIVLSIDSPGGHVKGVNELSKQIAAVRGVKPIVAYIGGDGASAAYWLASAADRIVADEAANIGSIGAMTGVRLVDGKPGERTYMFVSSQSPLKNAGPETDAGAKEMQRHTDDLAQVFIEAIAGYRGTDSQHILDNYGQGAVFTGAKALERGMIDAIGTLEGLVEQLSNNQPAIGGYIAGAMPMSQPNIAGAQNELPEITAALISEKYPEVAAQLRAEGAAAVDVESIKSEARSEGAKAEAERIKEIEALAMPGTEALVAQLKADPSVSPSAAAMQIIKAAQANPAAGHLANLRNTEANLAAPAASVASEGQADDLDAAAAADMAAAKAAGII